MTKHKSEMEYPESLYNSVRKSFDGYAEHPIVPEMIRPVRNADDLSSPEEEAAKAENRRESSISMQSDLSMGTTASEPNLPHMKCFRTPSVVVSDHSGDIGCVTLEEIDKIHGVYHRRSRSRSRNERRHSEIYADVNHDIERMKINFFDVDDRTESSFSGSANSDVTEYFKGSKFSSPVPRRKTRWYRNRRKAFSLDETIMDLDCGREKIIPTDRKFSNFSECSSNELSPILPRRSSSFYSETSSRRSSTFSEISPVFQRKNFHFDLRKNSSVSEFSGTCSLSPGRRRSTNGHISPIHSSFFHSRDSLSLDDIDLHFLERQRSLSVDDLYVDSSANSDFSFSDISTDFSASSSLSNLTGILYYSNYSPNQDCGLDYRSGRSRKHFDRTGRSFNIKTSKSCSDFLSVSRILEDYPNLRRRRHSNGQVPCDISEYRDQMQKINEEWLPKREDTENLIEISKGVSARNNLRLKSFHESMNKLNRENDVYVTKYKRRSKSIESIVKDAISEVTNGISVVKYFRDEIVRGPKSDDSSAANIGEGDEKIPTGDEMLAKEREWLSRARQENDLSKDDFSRQLKTTMVRKSFARSALSGEIQLPANLAAAKEKVKVRNATAVFIMNLSVSDLMFCCFNLPLAASTFYSRSWRHGKLLCQLFPLLRYGLLAVSLFTVLAITINRYVMIGHPTLYPMLYRKEYLGLMVACTWICGFGALVATWMGVWGQFGLDRQIGSCSILPDEKGRSPKTFLFMVAFVIPCIAIVVCYARIFYIVRRTALKSHSGPRTTKLTRCQSSKLSSVGQSSIKKFLKSKNTSSGEDSAIGTSTTGASGTISTDRSSSAFCEGVHIKNGLERSPTTFDKEIKQNIMNASQAEKMENFSVKVSLDGEDKKQSQYLEQKLIPNLSFLHKKAFSDTRINVGREVHRQQRYSVEYGYGDGAGGDKSTTGSPAKADIAVNFASSGNKNFLEIPMTTLKVDSDDELSTCSGLGGERRKKRSVNLSFILRRNNSSRRRVSAGGGVSAGKMSSKDKKLLKMILVIFLSFLICYLPITISKTFRHVLEIHSLNIAGYVLIYLTTCINPIIYVVMSSEYRQAYKNLLTCKTTDVAQQNRSGSQK